MFHPKLFDALSESFVELFVSCSFRCLLKVSAMETLKSFSHQQIKQTWSQIQDAKAFEESYSSLCEVGTIGHHVDESSSRSPLSLFRFVSTRSLASVSVFGVSMFFTVDKMTLYNHCYTK